MHDWLFQNLQKYISETFNAELFLINLLLINILNEHIKLIFTCVCQLQLYTVLWLKKKKKDPYF